MLDIVTVKSPNAEVLRKRSAKIPVPVSKEMLEELPEMIETMRRADGVGLAAPQVGRSIRLFVIEVDGRVSIFLNPNIVFRSKETATGEEGCLSRPGEFYPITRSKRITVEYDDLDGKRLSLDAEGFSAVVIQHEYDHLEGILISDRFKKQRPEDTYAL
jgi:peptide deformylase